MNLLYEDEHIIVLEKPAGIAVQSASSCAKDLESELKKYRKRKGEAPEIFVVHRLDQPVCGLMVFAKTKEAAAALSKGMQSDDYSKDYRATVYSPKPVSQSGFLEDYLLKDVSGNRSSVVDPKVKGAKKSALKYQVTGISEFGTEVMIHLLTGRHHQIRVQFAHAGFPLLGDLKYGTEESIQYSQEHGISNVCLCACHISFIHPITGKNMEFTI